MASERALHIPDELSRILVLYRERTRALMRPVVAGGVLDYVERAVGLDLPDDIVAFFAATSRDLHQIARLTEASREEGDVPSNHIVIAEGDDSLCEWRAELVVTDGRVRRRAPTEVSYYSVFGERLSEALSVTEFARRHLKILPHDADAEQIPFEVALANFRPGVVREETTRRRQVRHPRFGVGTVLRELERGKKIEVRFGRERVLLMATFCEELDDQKVAS